MMDQQLSVVIPIYNDELYLDRCLESIINQTYKFLDIILVDDGSTDNSKNVIEKYMKSDSRIRYFKENNAGAFQARKKGVFLSKSDIVTFLDADDYIEKNTYNNLMKLYKIYSPDIICYNYIIHNTNAISECDFKSGLYTINDIQNCIIPKMMFNLKTGYRGLNPSVGCKIIKKSIYLEVVAHVDDRITWGDDALVTYPSICLADTVYIDNNHYYQYCNNTNSSTHKFKYEIINDLKIFKKNILYTMKKYNKKIDWDFQVNNYMRTYVEMLINKWFNIHRTSSMYLFPYNLVQPYSEIVIYGAGEVGKSYVTELLQNEYAKILGWYDKEKYGDIFGDILIRNPKEIIKEDMDYLIIAINDKDSAIRIRKKLIDMGVSEKKIKWSKPILRA